MSTLLCPSKATQMEYAMLSTMLQQPSPASGMSLVQAALDVVDVRLPAHIPDQSFAHHHAFHRLPGPVDKGLPDSSCQEAERVLTQLLSIAARLGPTPASCFSSGSQQDCCEGLEDLGGQLRHGAMAWIQHRQQDHKAGICGGTCTSRQLLLCLSSSE